MNRRHFLRMGACTTVGASVSGWFDALAHEAAGNPQRKRSCILLWMNGGPSQIDTFDPKPGHANGGPLKPVQTSVPGLQFGEYLPQLAKQAKHLAVIRSMSTKEGDHGRATFVMRTGYNPQGAIQYPYLGSLIGKELSPPDAELPDVVAVAPFRFFNFGAFSSGFLGPKYAPLIIGEGGFFQPNQDPNAYLQALKVADMERPADVDSRHHDARIELLEDLEKRFLAGRHDAPAQSHLSAYERAVRMMKSQAARAFKLEDEPDRVRDRYGRSLFGQGCLLARRLVERGVPFVEVTLSGIQGAPGGWDTHQGNFTAMKTLCGVLDPAWSSLMDDLQQRGLLDTTMVVWMGEFGRTPRINPGQGRDHFPNAWSVVVGGGGIKGGQAVGKTSADGNSVVDRPVSVPDLLASICKGLGIDPMKQNPSNVGRPIRIVDKAARALNEIVM
jgi:uncharacterized protein DUF1501